MAKKDEEQIWDGNVDANGNAPVQEAAQFDGNPDALGNAPRRNTADIKDNPLFKDLDSFDVSKMKPFEPKNDKPTKDDGLSK